MDDFQLYNSALTAAQINSIYQSGATAYGALPTANAVQIANGATLDLQGGNQTVTGLSDSSGSGGTVTSTGTAQPTLTIQPGGGSATFSGVIANSGTIGVLSLTVNGPGTQVLAGSNTYTGLTTISGGTLQLGSGGTTGSINPSSTVVDNGVLAFNHSNNYAPALTINGTGGVTQLGSGTLQLSGGKMTYTGSTTVSNGVLQLPSGLIAYYKFDGSLNDSSPNGNNSGVGAAPPRSPTRPRPRAARRWPSPAVTTSSCPRLRGRP